MTTSPPQAPTYPISVSVKWLPRVNFIIIAALLLVHCAMWTYNYRVHELPVYITDLLDVDNEQSLENGYSSFALAIAAGLALSVAGRKKRDADRDVGYWLGLGIGFSAMAIEEVAGVHESINAWMGGGWTVWGLGVAAIIGLAYLRFLWRLPPRTRWQFLVAGGIYVGGEMVVQRLNEVFYNLYGGVESLPYKYLAAIKEGGEMVGVALFMRAILLYMSANAGSVVVDVELSR